MNEIADGEEFSLNLSLAEMWKDFLVRYNRLVEDEQAEESISKTDFSTVILTLRLCVICFFVWVLTVLALVIVTIRSFQTPLCAADAVLQRGELGMFTLLKFRSRSLIVHSPCKKRFTGAGSAFYGVINV